VTIGSCAATSAVTSVQFVQVPASPFISNTGTTAFCNGQTLTLTSVSSSGNLWSTGATTQSITVSTPGAYSLSINGCSDGNPVSVTKTYCEPQVSLKIYIEGFYDAVNNNLYPVLDPINYPTICDSIRVFLVDSASGQTAGTANGVISTQGLGTFNFSSLLPGRKYYIKVIHRNSLTVFSRQPFLFLTQSVFFDFTSY